MDIMHKILKSFKCGDSVVLSLTPFIREGVEYLVSDDDCKITIEPFRKS